MKWLASVILAGFSLLLLMVLAWVFLVFFVGCTKPDPPQAVSCGEPGLYVKNERLMKCFENGEWGEMDGVGNPPSQSDTPSCGPPQAFTKDDQIIICGKDGMWHVLRSPFAPSEKDAPELYKDPDPDDGITPTEEEQWT